MTDGKPYWLRVLLALDQAANVIMLNGDEDETISSRLGKAERGDYGPRWRWWVAAPRRLVNAFFRLFGQRDHCAESIEEDEGLRKS